MNDKIKMKLPLLLCVISVFAFPATSSPTGNFSEVTLTINFASPIHTTDDRFVSFALDAIVVYQHFPKFRIGDQKLIKMMKLLAPAYWRIGGTSADRLLFSPTGFSAPVNATHEKLTPYDRPWETFTGSEWVGLMNMAQQAGVDVVFDLNVLERDGANWDATNSRQFMDFSDSHGFDLHFQLGNEPDAFERTFGQNVDATQLGKDFRTCKNIMREYPRYANSLLIGPDLAGLNTQFMNDFIKQNRLELDVMAWHHYYFDGATAGEYDFMDAGILDGLQNSMTNANNINSAYGYKLWLSETSSAWGAGSEKYSDKFIAMYMWLDKLGIAAKNGLEVVVRQDLTNGHYALVDPDYNPNPDWWLSILFKKLVGNQVLSCNANAGNKVRFYCHCAKNRPGFATVYGMNLENNAIDLRLEGLVPSGFKTQNINVDAYVLTSNGQPLEKNVRLNGNDLRLVGDNDLPDLNPKSTSADPNINVPSHALAFYVVPANGGICG